MTTESIDRIRKSFAQIVPQMDRVTQNFYDRVFAARPDVRALFRTDMKTQQQHFAAALALIVRNLPMLDALECALIQLGADHARVGVRPEHYPLVRDAILASLADALDGSADWTAAHADDWRRLIEHVCTHMLQGGLGVTKDAEHGSSRA